VNESGDILVGDAWNQAVPKRGQVQFRVTAQVGRLCHQLLHKVRCDNVLEKRQVPLPEPWKVALRRAVILPVKIAKARQRLQSSQLDLEIKCEFLGMPKKISAYALSDPSEKTFEEPIGNASVQRRHLVGEVVTLRLPSSPDARGKFLLCAHAGGNCWLCHGGKRGKTGVSLDPDNPLDPSELLLRDIVANAWCSSTSQWPSKHRRVPTHAMGEELTTLPKERPMAFQALVAYAHWQLKAGVCQGNVSKGNTYEQADVQAFELNPWHFEDCLSQGAVDHSASNWVSQMPVAMQWSWRYHSPTSDSSVKSKWQHELVLPLVNDLMKSTRYVPQPTAFRDVHLERRLRRVAEVVAKRTKAPCRYLGAFSGPANPEVAAPSSFEPDPNKWPARLYADTCGKSQAEVWFEYLGVQLLAEEAGLRSHRVRT
jgi:hypothetical protein